MGLTDHYFEKYWSGFLDDYVDLFLQREPAQAMQVIQWPLGEDLEGKWTDGEYYYGRVSKIFKNGKHKFVYDDGAKPRNLLPGEIRKRTPIVKFGLPDVQGIAAMI